MLSDTEKAHLFSLSSEVDHTASSLIGSAGGEDSLGQERKMAV